MNLRRGLSGALLALAALLATGCATPPRPAPVAGEAGSVWTGRMALQVEERADQSFSAGFELRGTAQSGQLVLYTPFGGTLARLVWSPGVATLEADGQTRQFPSVDALAAQATGTAIPVAALFDWLAGVPTQVPGWQADLSGRAEGRLRARRTDPPPSADLRIAFER